ncbi:ABC transporter permease [Actinomycetes bacterium]|nr:ABC transporter permease [Actinomycetes bacterium]
MTIKNASYSSAATLGIRVEFIRQVKRRRTLVAFLLVIALPLIVVAAVTLGPSAGGGGGGGGGFGDGGLDLIGLATSGAWNFTLTMLLFSSGFLLLIIAAMFMGDTVASEASWSTLRYLLVAPVPRRRLLRSKAIVGLILIVLVLLTLVAASLLIGALAFGTGPLTSPLGGALDSSESMQRIALITLYIGVTLLFPAGFAFLMSVLTDVPLGAVGVAVVTVIVLNILGAIEPLGDLRRLLPTDYGDSWLAALSPTIGWNDMALGATFNIVVFALLMAIAVIHFDRKDIVS